MANVKTKFKHLPISKHRAIISGKHFVDHWRHDTGVNFMLKRKRFSKIYFVESNTNLLRVHSEGSVEGELLGCPGIEHLLGDDIPSSLHFHHFIGSDQLLAGVRRSEKKFKI